MMGWWGTVVPWGTSGPPPPAFLQLGILCGWIPWGLQARGSMQMKRARAALQMFLEHWAHQDTSPGEGTPRGHGHSALALSWTRVHRVPGAADLHGL